MAYREELKAIPSRASKVAFARRHLLRVSTKPDGDRFVFRIRDAGGEVLDEFACSKESFPRISSGKQVDERPSSRWRFYETAAGGKPVLDFIATLSEHERARLKASMDAVRRNGLTGTKQLRGTSVRQISAETGSKSLRLLFSPEGKHGHVLLALFLYDKNTDQMPQQVFELAGERLREWRRRGEEASINSIRGSISSRTLLRGRAREERSARRR